MVRENVFSGTYGKVSKKVSKFFRFIKVVKIYYKKTLNRHMDPFKFIYRYEITLTICLYTNIVSIYYYYYQNPSFL